MHLRKRSRFLTQNLKDFAYSRGLVHFSLYVCMCLFMCYFREHRTYRSESKKCKQNTSIDFDIFHENVAIANVILCDLNLHFQGHLIHISDVNISETIRACAKKMRDTAPTVVDVCKRRVKLRKLIYLTLA